MDLLTALCDAVRCASWHWVLDKLIEGRRRKYETSNDKSRKWSRIKRNGTDDKRLAFLWNGGDLSKQKASRQPRHVIQGRTLCYFWRESGKGPGNRPSLDFMLSSLWGYEDDFRNEPNRRPKCKNDETFWNSGRRFYQNFPTKSESHWHEIGHLACWVCVRGRHIRSGGKNQKEFKPGRTTECCPVSHAVLASVWECQSPYCSEADTEQEVCWVFPWPGGSMIWSKYTFSRTPSNRSFTFGNCSWAVALWAVLCWALETVPWSLKQHYESIIHVRLPPPRTPHNMLPISRI